MPWSRSSAGNCSASPPASAGRRRSRRGRRTSSASPRPAPTRASTVNNWAISYGDGTTHTLFGDSVADLYTYETPSSPTYEITATVFDTESGGATYSDSAGQAVTVDAATASLGLTPDPTAVIGEPFAITGNVSEGGNHTLSAYAITWGDGGSSSDASLPQDFTGSYADTLSHTYASTGTYDVTATAVTDQGTTTATTAIVAAPLFYSDYDPNGYTVGQAFDLTPTFTDPGHTLASYVVSWGDGSASSTYAAGTADFAHDYTADSASPYQATIIAAADDGTWTDVESLSVAPPTLSVSAPASATQGAAYTLTAGVTSGETLGSTYNFTIDWGDGAGAQGLSAPAGPLTYDYAEPGTYTISVEADGDGGQGDFAEATVDVAVATPTVAVAHEDATATAGIAGTFTDSYANPGGDPLDNLTVDWGDGNEDAYYLDPHSEAHAYAHPGSYDVTDTFVTDHDTYTASTAIDVVDAGSLSFSDAGGTIEGSVFFVYATLNEPDGQTPSNYHVAWGDGQQDDWGPASQGTFTHVYNTLNGSPGLLHLRDRDDAGRHLHLGGDAGRRDHDGGRRHGPHVAQHRGGRRAVPGQRVLAGERARAHHVPGRRSPGHVLDRLGRRPDRYERGRRHVHPRLRLQHRPAVDVPAQLPAVHRDRVHRRGDDRHADRRVHRRGPGRVGPAQRRPAVEHGRGGHGDADGELRRREPGALTTPSASPAVGSSSGATARPTRTAGRRHTCRPTPTATRASSP